MAYDDVCHDRVKVGPIRAQKGESDMIKVSKSAEVADVCRESLLTTEQENFIVCSKKKNVFA